MSGIRKKSVFTVIVLMAAFGLPFLFYHNRHDYTSTFFSLDTVVSVRSDKNITDAVRKEITSLDAVFDSCSENSEITELNVKKEMVCSSELTDLILKTETLNRTYGYGVDISAGRLTDLWRGAIETGIIPDEEKIDEILKNTENKKISVSGDKIILENGACIDPGAVAKGYALDRVKHICEEAGSGYTVISTGSASLLYSSDPDRVFTCAVRADKDRIAGTAETGSCFVSTSGDYERCTVSDGRKFHHIIDMNTGYPASSGLSSVTVFCSDGITSDFLSTLIFTEGKDKLGKYLDSEKFKVVAVDAEGNIIKSRSLIFHPNKEQTEPDE